MLLGMGRHARWCVNQKMPDGDEVVLIILFANLFLTKYGCEMKSEDSLRDILQCENSGLHP